MGQRRTINNVVPYVVTEINVFPDAATKIAKKMEVPPFETLIDENTRFVIRDYWPAVGDSKDLYFQAQARALANASGGPRMSHMEPYNYSFFEESLQTLRRLRAHSMGISYLMVAPSEIFPDLDLGIAPCVLEGGEDDPSHVILTRSYARKPGGDLKKLEATLRNKLPEDFLAFHRLYDEALVTTRTFPIHLWSEEKILRGIELFRDLSPSPLRLFRFGDYWERESLYFALWNESVDSGEWRVVIAEWEDRDQLYENDMDEEYVLGSSFHPWLESLIERDGLPDPFMTRFGQLDLA